MNTTAARIPAAAPLADESPPDEVLVRRVLAGDLPAFEPIVQRHNRRLFRVAWSVLGDGDEAEDAVQESYISAYAHLHRWTPSAPLSAWLTRICLNHALMRRRSPALARRVSLDEIVHDVAVEDDADRQLERSRLRTRVESALRRLPAPLSTVFVLRELEELDTRETALSLGIPEATVKTRLHRARRALRADPALTPLPRAGLLDFAGARCGRLLRTVMARLRGMRAPV